MTSSCYVFVRESGESVICGSYRIAPAEAHFTYAKSWLQHEHAFALDPVNLPLRTEPFIFKNSRAEIGVLADAGPDSWGRKIQLSQHRQAPSNELEWLLVSSGKGAGCLAFSAARSSHIEPPATPDFSQVHNFIGLFSRIESGDAVDYPSHPEWEALLAYGSPMGGAKPKLLVCHEGREWIAKFNRGEADIVDVARIEYATRELAIRVGIDVPAMQLHVINGQSVLLIERFDRDASGPRHYLSARSLLNAVRVRQDDAKSSYSYGQLVDKIRPYTRDAKALAHQLYRRMVFNVLIGNSDDHSRNHGFLKQRGQLTYQLSPAFDMSPQAGTTHQHGLGIGDEGASGTCSNLSSQCQRFLLTKAEALAIIDEQRSALADWAEVYARHEVRPGHIAVLRRCFQALD